MGGPPETGVSDGKTHHIADIVRSRLHGPTRRAIVVGCGSGIEAAVLATQLGIEVVGIDVQTKFDAEASKLVQLQWGDATKMQFADSSFDFLYSYHALEHIPEYRAALAEIRRVLRIGGLFFIGTPNRSRAIGYLGSKHASFRQKIEWNLTDWKARLLGKFRNEHGAHAGFTRPELQSVLRDTLGPPEDVTLDYYRRVYARHVPALELLEKTRISRLLLPSVYFAGLRRS